MATVRTNIRIPEDLHSWYKTRSEEMGIPMNALMMLALNHYYKEEVIVPQIPRMMELMEKQMKAAADANGGR